MASYKVTWLYRFVAYAGAGYRELEQTDGSLGYNAERYAELLLRAVESVLAPAGISADMLQQWMTKPLPTPHVHARLAAKTARVYWGPLFEFVKRGETKSWLAV